MSTGTMCVALTTPRSIFRHGGVCYRSGLPPSAGSCEAATDGLPKLLRSYLNNEGNR